MLLNRLCLILVSIGLCGLAYFSLIQPFFLVLVLHVYIRRIIYIIHRLKSTSNSTASKESCITSGTTGMNFVLVITTCHSLHNTNASSNIGIEIIDSPGGLHQMYTVPLGNTQPSKPLDQFAAFEPSAILICRIAPSSPVWRAVL